MGTSAARKKAYLQSRQPQESGDMQKAAPSPASMPQKTAGKVVELAPAQPKPVEEELNFQLLPGGLLQAEGAVRAAPVKQKTWRGDNVLNAHIAAFQARNPCKWSEATTALWRALMEEEHLSIERAKAESEVTGVPARPVLGPVYRAWVDQLDRMKEESLDD
ncbi:hypothetical protein [Streptomyces sp. cg35]|uniref:hypothetical protein n=1 Tax=Streptomyces sp. cg35 TaxID=3421650 RepID=UPI003D16C331